MLPLILLMLVGCAEGSSHAGSFSNTSNETSFIPKILSPIGAPAITLYNYADSSRFETNSDVAQVKNAFMTSVYDVIIMDHTVGIGQILTNQAPFKLARIITKGNYYLVGIDKDVDAIPQTGDRIVSFGQTAGIPNQILHTLFPDILATTQYVDSVTLAASVLKTGKYDAQNVDYVLMAQPALYNVLQSSGYTTEGKLNTIINIQEAWHDLSGLEGFPQAGIFVRNETLTTYPSAMTAFLNQYDDAIENCIEDPELVVNHLANYGNLEAQTVRFGMNQSIFLAMQEQTQNQLGLTAGSVDLDGFRTYMGEEVYPSSIYASIYQ